MFSLGNFREIILYSNRYTPIKHEVSNKRSDISHNNNNSYCPYNLWTLSVLRRCVNTLRLDSNIYGISFLRIHLGRSIAFFIGEKHKEKREKIENLKKHTEDLIPELKKWAEAPLMFSKEPLFVLAQQHIKDTELWDIIEGSNGIRATQSQYDTLEDDVLKQIETAIKKNVSEKLPKFEIENLNWFVEDIKEFIEQKLSKDKSYIFVVETDASITPYKYYISSVRPDGSSHRSKYQKGAKENLEKLAEILNNILNDAQLHQMIKALHDLGQRLYNRRATFREKMNLIINNTVYAVSDEDRILLGKCKRCEHIKKKLKIS